MTLLAPTSETERASQLCCYRLDPTKDARWAELVSRHPSASVFHTPAWLQALKRTYGYQPVAFTTSPPTGPLKNGLAFCQVKSWLTGSRLVSLPFSDHCEPLCDSTDDLGFLVSYLQKALEQESWKYIEIRSVGRNMNPSHGPAHTESSTNYLLHVLDLQPDLTDIFRRLDRDSVQRRIRRADRANLIEESGRSERLLEEFYGLFVATRGRHRLPPSPFAWFKNLLQCQGNAATIRVARHAGKAVAAILTLRFRNVLYYKYGCSDERFKSLGATPWLLWKAIVDAKETGATAFDLGRTEEGHTGLLAFKSHWVSQAQLLNYWSFPYVSRTKAVNGWQFRAAKRLFSYVPDRLLTLTGRIIYRHIG